MNFFAGKSISHNKWKYNPRRSSAIWKLNQRSVHSRNRRLVLRLEEALPQNLATR
jgi:hypothetical protein